MSRRINIDSYQNVKAATSRLDLPVVSVLASPQTEWRKLCYGGRRMAHSLEVDWKKYNINDFIFTHCFLPGNKILMSDGTEKNIEEIKVGDFVITHKGRPRRVSSIMKREVNENILHLKFANLRETTCTKEHPFYVVPKKDSMCKHNKLHQKCTFGKFSWRCKYFDCATNCISPSFRKAGELKKGDKSFLPRIEEVIDIPFFTRGKARLLGYYTAEGRVDIDKREENNAQKSVRFSIHIKELPTIGQDIIDLMKQEFGVLSHSKFGNKESNGITISFTSTIAADWFLKHVGIGSSTKKFSKEVMYLSPEIQAEILYGWILGDGNISKRDALIRISTISKNLVSQGLVLFQRIDSVALEYVCGKERDKEIVGRTCHVNECYHISIQNKRLGLLSKYFTPKIFSRGARSGQRYSDVNNNIYSELLSILEKNYKGFVYNFSVEEDESYVVNRNSVHNCSIVSSVAAEQNGYYIKPVCAPIVNANGNAWTNEVLLATFKSFIGGENYQEHVQVPSLSKGKILDAVLRPFTYKDNFGNTADVFICDILVATSRIHWDLVQKIQSGQLSTLSMGCVAKYVQCSKCGQLFSDDEDSCDHIKHELLTTFVDENGITRIVAELCGRSIWDATKNCWVGDSESNKYIEASWVENPAFKGAVVNHLIEANAVDPKIAKILASANELDIMAEDYGKLRVADRYSMIAIRLAREEYFKRKRMKTIDNILKG